jgi:hypothetical protein
MNQKAASCLFNEGEVIGFKREVTSALTDRASSSFYLINPVKSLAGPASIENIASFRNILVEFDGMNSIEEQWTYVKEIRMPWSVCTFSGSKSLHFIIALQQGLEQELYSYWARLLVRAVEGADTSSANPNRLSRTPGAARFFGSTAVEQELIEVRERVSITDLSQWLLLGPLKRQVNQIIKQDAEQAAKSLLPLPEGGMTILPNIYRDMIREGALHPECTSRHESLVKFATWLSANWHNPDEIEQLLWEASEGMGLPASRGDVYGILKWLRR